MESLPDHEDPGMDGGFCNLGKGCDNRGDRCQNSSVSSLEPSDVRIDQREELNEDMTEMIPFLASLLLYVFWPLQPRGVLGCVVSQS